MKKFTLTLIGIIITYFSYSQKGKFIIGLGITAPSYTSIVLESEDYTIKESSTPFQIEVGYFLGKNLQLSIGINNSSSTSNYVNVYSSGNLLYSYNHKVSMTTMLVKGNYYYLNKEKWQLGSGLALGTGFVNVKSEVVPSYSQAPNFDGGGGLALHINLFEARFFPIPNLGIYGNLGLGNQGLIGLGLVGRL